MWQGTEGSLQPRALKELDLGKDLMSELEAIPSPVKP